VTEATYSVTGMTCDHCVRAVQAEIGKIAGVASVTVDLGAGHVTLQSEGTVDPAAVRAAVEEAGYEVTG
jgi:copper ion binding protein